jgi:hypothetical protein
MHNDIFFGAFALCSLICLFSFPVSRAFLLCTISCCLPCEALFIAGRHWRLVFSGMWESVMLMYTLDGVYSLLDS